MAHGPKLHFKKLTQDPATNTLENKHQPGPNDSAHLHNIPYAVHVKALLIFGSIAIVRPARESNLSVHESVWREKRAACASWDESKIEAGISWWRGFTLWLEISLHRTGPSSVIYAAENWFHPPSCFPISPSAEAISRILPLSPQLVSLPSSTCLTTAYFGNQSSGTGSCAGTSQRKGWFSTLAGKVWPIK